MIRVQKLTSYVTNKCIVINSDTCDELLADKEQHQDHGSGVTPPRTAVTVDDVISVKER